LEAAAGNCGFPNKDTVCLLKILYWLETLENRDCASVLNCAKLEAFASEGLVKILVDGASKILFTGYFARTIPTLEGSTVLFSTWLECSKMVLLRGASNILYLESAGIPIVCAEVLKSISWCDF
jgi:hypothetical protein